MELALNITVVLVVVLAVVGVLGYLMDRSANH